jgi:hypothetical protein
VDSTEHRAQSTEQKKFCPEPPALSPELTISPDGEIGRRASFRD